MFMQILASKKSFILQKSILKEFGMLQDDKFLEHFDII